MLHQTTQRRLCRALFLLACLLPTAGVVGAIAWRMRPDYSQTQLAGVARGLGVRIECGRCATPRPGERSFADLRVLHPETGALVATLDALRVAEGADGLVGQAGVLRIEEGRLSTAGELLCESLRVVGARIASIEFAEVRCGDELLAAAARLSAESPSPDCRVWTLAESAPAGRSLRLVRNRQVDPPATRLTLQTGERPVAWSKLASLTPLPADLGAAATVAGEVTLELESRAGRVKGELRGVDLRSLTPAEAGVRTHLPAELAAANVAWRDARLTSLDVSIHAGAGEASWWFADHARWQTKCLLAGPMLEAFVAAGKQGAYPGETVAFDQLAFRLQLDGAGCRVTGLLPPAGEPAGPALMLRGGEPMLTAAGDKPVPLDALLPLVKTPDAATPYACPRAVALLEKLPKQEQALRR